MLLQLRQQIVDCLNSTYLSSRFKKNMSCSQMIQATTLSLRQKLDYLYYDLNAEIVSKYEIKLKPSQQQPFTQQEYNELHLLQSIVQSMMKSKMSESNNYFNQLNNFIQKYSIQNVKLNQKYHKFKLRFRTINLKQAILLEVLSKNQIFYTIVRQRRKSGKQFALDPLINKFQQIKTKLSIIQPFHQTILPRRQVRNLQKKSTDKKMKNLLFQAVSNRKYKEVKDMLVRGASIEQQGIIQRANQLRQMNCSHRACQLGDLQMCKILDSFNVNWQARQKEGMTPLHYAVQSGNLQLVKFLIQQAKVDKQAVDSQQRSAFYFACTQGDMNTIIYLYQKGCNINNRSKLGRSALSKACYLGLIDVVNFLMNCPQIQLNSKDQKGRTALHNSVFGPKGGRQGHKFGTNQKDSPQCTQILLQKGFEVDIKDKQQNTPLHVAMSSQGIDSARILIAFGASLTALNCYKQTPLMTGSKFGHLSSIKILKEEYGDSLLVKDLYNKNLILLCAKFRQDDGKNINSVFYYAVDEILGYYSQGLQLQARAYYINNWNQEINYTFVQLLKQRKRVRQQFIYFCRKCMQMKIVLSYITIDTIKELLNCIKEENQKQDIQIAEYMIGDKVQCKNFKDKSQFENFIRWLLKQNSISLIELYIKISKISEQSRSKQLLMFQQSIINIFFQIIDELKDKMITYCLTKININWIQYVEKNTKSNILHILVKNKKIGSLIQVLKILSGIKLDFATNKYISKFQHLENHLLRLLLQQDSQKFNPYSLALLLKDASAVKLLQQKMPNNQYKNKFQFQVRQVHILQQKDQKQLQQFKGYQIQQQLQEFINKLTDQQYFKQYYPFLFSHQQIDFTKIWKNIQQRPFTYIHNVNQVNKLQIIKQTQIIGIDIQYFYCQGATLISIMQISTFHQDFIIDFLTSATSFQTNFQFIKQVRNILKPVFYNPKIIKIMHGSYNDLCVIKSILNISFLNFVDTAKIDVQIRKKQNIRGLAALVGQYLQEHMSKDYQVSQWRIRPIPASMLDYARRDSLVLPFLILSIFKNIPLNQAKQMLIAVCKHARKNKKTNQPLIHAIQFI